MVYIVLFKGMLLSQIKWGMLETTLILIDSLTPIVLLIDVSKNTQVLTKQIPMGWFRPMVNPCHLLKWLTPFSLSAVAVSPSPLNPFLLVSLSLLSALLLDMFYLFWFLLNTRQIKCLIIIDLNKLIWTTMLLHLEVAHNTNGND